MHPSLLFCSSCSFTSFSIILKIIVCFMTVDQGWTNFGQTGAYDLVMVAGRKSSSPISLTLSGQLPALTLLCHIYASLTADSQPLFSERSADAAGFQHGSAVEGPGNMAQLCATNPLGQMGPPQVRSNPQDASRWLLLQGILSNFRKILHGTKSNSRPGRKEREFESSKF